MGAGQRADRPEGGALSARAGLHVRRLPHSTSSRTRGPSGGLSSEQTTTIVADLGRLPNADGGWSLSSLREWPREEGSAQDPSSDDRAPESDRGRFRADATAAFAVLAPTEAERGR